MILSLVLFLIGLFFLLFGPVGWVLGSLLIAGAILVFIFSAVFKTGKAVSRSVTTKKCPYCQERISAKALVCTNCQSLMPEHPECSSTESKSVSANME